MCLECGTVQAVLSIAACTADCYCWQSCSQSASETIHAAVYVFLCVVVVSSCSNSPRLAIFMRIFSADILIFFIIVFDKFYVTLIIFDFCDAANVQCWPLFCAPPHIDLSLLKKSGKPLEKYSTGCFTDSLLFLVPSHVKLLMSFHLLIQQWEM